MNLEKAKEMFEKYVNTFDLENDKIFLKIKHSYKVMELSKRIATDLNLTIDQIELATLIGLLHDIGRFYQLKLTDSFNDKQFDHSDYGVMYLFEKNHIRDYIQVTDYDEIIRKAILYHNDFELPNNLEKTEELFCKIIRDADKIDIFRVYYEKFTFFFNIKEVNPKVVNDFFKGKSILKDDIKSKSDRVLCVLAFINDMNFNESFKLLKNTNYFNNFVNSIEVDNDSYEDFNKLINFCNEIIERRVKDVG